MQARILNRPCRYDSGEQPVCGRLLDHKGGCLSEDVMEQARKRVKEWKANNRR